MLISTYPKLFRNQGVPMRLLRLAIETNKWDLAAHIIILGAITARQKEKVGPDGVSKRTKGRPRGRSKRA